ncbi:MAG: ABC transporter permease [Solirubrobacterales bacterium]
MSLASLAAVLAQVELRDRSEDSGCVADNGWFCFGWAADNFTKYLEPLREHVVLVVIPVAVGFALALALAVISHRFRWLVPPLTFGTGVLYTIPSLAAFFLLLPVTGRGFDTAAIALTAYTLQILYRNTMAGLDNVPDGAKDAGRGMGLTRWQLLWRVELPLALPEIVAGLRIASVTTVGLAVLATFAGAGGLGDEILRDITFRTNVLIAGGLAVLMAFAIDAVLLGAQRLASPWKQVA